MTLNEMTLHIAEQLNLSSPDAKARIGRNINVRYKRVTSAIGMVATRREEVSEVVTIGDRNVTFDGVERLDAVFRKVGTKNVMLREVTNDEMLELNPRTEPPTAYSIFSVSPTAVTIKLDCTPTTSFTLYAHALSDTTTLTGNDSPAFPESFHDILIHGVMADEYRKMEKPQISRESEIYYEQRLSDLKMFIAKSAFLDIYANKHGKSDGWWDSGGR